MITGKCRRKSEKLSVVYKLDVARTPRTEHLSYCKLLRTVRKSLVGNLEMSKCLDIINAIITWFFILFGLGSEFTVSLCDLIIEN